MIDVVPPDDTVERLLPAQRQLVPDTVRKIGRFRESANKNKCIEYAILILVRECLFILQPTRSQQAKVEKEEEE